MADQTVSIRFIADYYSRLSGLNREINRLATTAQGASTKAAGGLSTLARFSQIAGTALMLGVGAALAVGIKASIDFESSFAGVRKTVDAAEPSFERLAKNIRAMATEIPINVNDLNRIAELGGQLGVPIEALEQFTEVIAKLGVTTNLDIESAATGFARLANVMGTRLDDFDNMGSAVVDLGNNFATTEEEIVNFALRLSGIGATVGLSEQDVLGLATAFTSLGEPAERGATALQRVFTGLQSFASSGGPNLQLAADLMGETVDAARDLIKENPAQAFIQLEQGLQKLGTTGGDVTGTIDALGFGAIRTSALLLKGAAGVDTLADAIRTSNEAWDDNIALNEEADKRFETTASQMTLLSNQFTELRMNVGDEVLPIFKDFLERLQGLFGVVEDNIGIVKAFGVVVLAMAIGRGATALLGWIAETIFQMGVMGTSMTGLGLGVLKVQRWVGLLAGGLGIAAIALLGIGIAMSGARARANEMRSAVRDLYEVMSDGQSNLEETQAAFETAFASTTGTAPFTWNQVVPDDLKDSIGLIHSLGVSFEEFMRMATSPGTDFDEWAANVLANLDKVDRDMSDKNKEMTDENIALAERNRQIQELIARIMQVRELITTERELTLFERLRVLGPNAGLEDELANIRELQGLLDKFGPDPKTSILDVMTQFLGDPEKAADILDDYEKTIEGFGEDWAQEWDGIISDFRDSLTNWEEILTGYKKVTAPKLKAIQRSLENWRTDTERLLSTNAAVIQNYGIDWQEFWFSLPETVRRSLAALREKSPREFRKAFNALFREGLKVDEDILTMSLQAAGAKGAEAIREDWPTYFQAALDTAAEGGLLEGSPEFNELVFDALTSWITQLSQTSPEVAAAVIESITKSRNLIIQDIPNFGGVVASITADMTRDERLAEFEKAGYDQQTAYLLALFSLPDSAADDLTVEVRDVLIQSAFNLAADVGVRQKYLTFGGTIAKDVAQGWAVLPALMSAVATDAAAAVDYSFRKAIQAQSPSKMSMSWGHDIMAGLQMGLAKATGPALFSNMKAPVQVNVASPASGPSITINNPQHKDDDIVHGLQRATTLVGLRRYAETAIGNN